MQLFFYGVLQGRLASPAIRRMLAGIGPGRPAVARGAPYAIADPGGCYPVMVPGSGQVRGMLHDAGSVDIDALDRFELYDPADPDGSEYLRREISVRVPGRGMVVAEAYLYNHRIAPGLMRIAHGDFGRWLAETGNAPLAG